MAQSTAPLQPVDYYRIKSQLVELQLRIMLAEHERERILAGIGIVGNGRVVLNDQALTVALEAQEAPDNGTAR